MNDQIIIKHYKTPHHYGKPNSSASMLSAVNAACGDEITLYFEKKDGKITQLAFAGAGCSICLASASILLDLAHEKGLVALETITEVDLLSSVDIPKEHKRSACVLLSFTALQKLLKEA